MGRGLPASSPSSIPTVKPSGPGACDGDGLPMRGVGRRLSMPGEGKMFATAGAGASLSLADGGEFLSAPDSAEPLAVALRDATSLVAIGGETFLMADGGEPLAVAVRGGTSSVAIGGEARMTGGGCIGTSSAGGGDLLAVGPGDKTPGLAELLHRLRPPHRHGAAVGEPWSVTDGGGAIESGGATEV
jgi:hypothetical protein